MLHIHSTIYLQFIHPFDYKFTSYTINLLRITNLPHTHTFHYEYTLYTFSHYKFILDTYIILQIDNLHIQTHILHIDSSTNIHLTHLLYYKLTFHTSVLL